MFIMLFFMYFCRCMVVENFKMKKSCKVYVDESEFFGGKLIVILKIWYMLYGI